MHKIETELYRTKDGYNLQRRMFGTGRPKAPYLSSVVGTFYTRTGTFFRINKFEIMEICTGTGIVRQITDIQYF